MFWIFPMYDLTEGKQTAGPRETSHVNASLCRNAFNGTRSPPPPSSFSRFRSHVQLTAQEVQFLCDCLQKWSHFSSSQNFLWAHALYFLLSYFNILPPRWAFLHSILSVPDLVFASSNPHSTRRLSSAAARVLVSWVSRRLEEIGWTGETKKGFIPNLHSQIHQKSLRPPSVARQISVKLGTDVFGSPLESVASPLSRWDIGSHWVSA